MAKPYVAPAYKLDAFYCPVCEAYSQQRWYQIYIDPDCMSSFLKDYPKKEPDKPLYPASVVGAAYGSDPSERQAGPEYTRIDEISISQCQLCEAKAIWIEGKMVHPAQSAAPYPNDDMPDDVKRDFMEAREIVERSPRAAAALLRLATERLVIHLGGDQKSDINNNIQFLVNKKGLPVRIQKALDVLRVVGNEAVHPGKIDVDDKAVAISLFNWINDIVTMMITNEKLIDEHYNSLPPDKLKGIEDRKERVQAASNKSVNVNKTN